MKLLAIASVAAAVAVTVVTAVATASVATTTLTATVGPGFTIALKADGKNVSKVKPGEYTIRVSDDSDQHDFHLSGPGVNKITSISGKPKTTWHVTLQKGHYTYVCDPHAAFMKGSFTVG